MTRDYQATLASILAGTPERAPALALFVADSPSWHQRAMDCCFEDGIEVAYCRSCSLRWGI